MCEARLKRIIEEACKQELSEYERAFRKRRFSLRFRRRLEKVFSEYEDRHRKERAAQVLAEKETVCDVQTAYAPTPAARKFRFNRKMLTYMLVIIFIGSMSVAVAGSLKREFAFETDNENTLIVPVECEDCPTTIKDVYYMSALPPEYKYISELSVSSDCGVAAVYINMENGRSVFFEQYLKDGLVSYYFNAEQNDFEEVWIHGNRAYCLMCGTEENEDENENGIITWDNGDYFLQISGELDKDSLIYLAKSTEIKKK